ETSSVTVLPISDAPASSRVCTAQACRPGTGWARAQSGLPPPVGCPATSKRSLAAKVRPESGPPPRPSTRNACPGTKAPTVSSTAFPPPAAFAYHPRRAGVAQWQSRSFPSLRRGFDSLHPLHRLAEDFAELPRADEANSLVFADRQQTRPVAGDEEVGLRRDRRRDNLIILRIAMHHAQRRAVGHHLRLGEKPTNVPAHIVVRVSERATKAGFRKQGFAGLGQDRGRQAELITVDCRRTKDPHDGAVRRQEGADQNRAIEDGSRHVWRGPRALRRPPGP